MRKPRPDRIIEEKQFIEDPHYTASGVRGAGGAHSTAILGPGPANGGRPDIDLPLNIAAAKQKYKDGFIKSGHILNQFFGGSGNDKNNLTILSAAGNGDHSFDDPIHRAKVTLRDIYELLHNDGIDIRDLELGIKIDAKVKTDTTWDGENGIFGGFNNDASLHFPDVKEITGEIENDRKKDRFNLLMEDLKDEINEADRNGLIDNPRAPLR